MTKYISQQYQLNNLLVRHCFGKEVIADDCIVK